MRVVILTNRLKLIKPSIEYAEQLFKRVVANRECLLPYLPWATNVTLESEQRYVEDSVTAWNAQKSYNYLVLIRQTDEIIGTIGSVEWTKDACEIGYWIDKNHHRRGFASEAMEAYEQELLSRGIAKSFLKVDANNTPSIAMAKKFCYTQDFRYQSDDGLLRFVKSIRQNKEIERSI